MALILCPECAREISDRAGVCPHCGNPMGDRGNADGKPVRVTNPAQDGVLTRNRGCADFFILAAVGVVVLLALGRCTH
jgi:hypothetical protein